MLERYGGFGQLARRTALVAIAGMVTSVVMLVFAQWVASAYAGGRMLPGFGSGLLGHLVAWALAIAVVGFLWLRDGSLGVRTGGAVLVGYAVLSIAGLAGWHTGFVGFAVYWLFVALVTAFATSKPAETGSAWTTTPSAGRTTPSLAAGRVPRSLVDAVRERAGWVQAAMERLKGGLPNDVQAHLARVLMAELMVSIWRDNRLALPDTAALHELARVPMLVREIVSEPTDDLTKAAYRAVLAALVAEWASVFQPGADAA